jgi:hypothetical protein
MGRHVAIHAAMLILFWAFQGVFPVMAEQQYACCALRMHPNLGSEVRVISLSGLDRKRNSGTLANRRQ